MPRVKPNTIYTPRVKPTTVYTIPRDWFCYTWDTIPWTWEEANFSWDDTCFNQVATNYSRPRYASYVEDITWANILDLSWELVQWISGNQVNKIDTVYT